MTPLQKDVKMVCSDEWKRFVTASKWLEDWCERCIASNIDPTKHKNYVDHQKRFESVIDDLEKKWKEIND